MGSIITYNLIPLNVLEIIQVLDITKFTLLLYPKIIDEKLLFVLTIIK